MQESDDGSWSVTLDLSDGTYHYKYVIHGENRMQNNGPNYNPRKLNVAERKKMRQAIALKMSFVGAPMTRATACR